MRQNLKIEGWQAVKLMQESRRKELAIPKEQSGDVTWWEWLVLQRPDPVVSVIVIVLCAYVWMVW